MKNLLELAPTLTPDEWIVLTFIYKADKELPLDKEVSKLELLFQDRQHTYERSCYWLGVGSEGRGERSLNRKLWGLCHA